MRSRTKQVLLLACGVLIAAAAIAVVRFAASEAAVVLLAQELAAASAGRLTIDAPRGSLAGVVHIATVRYEDEDLRVTARDVVLEASLRALASRRLALAQLAAGELEIVPKPSPGPSQPPATLALPLELAVDRAAIGSLIVVLDGERFEAHQVSFGYRGTPARHELRALRAEAPLGELQGEFALDAAPPFAAKGALSVARGGPTLPAAARATFSGSLARLAIALDATLAGAKLDGAAEVAPFAAVWLTRALLRATEIDLARIDHALPQTRLALEVSGSGASASAIAGTLSLRNATAGPLTDGRLPLAALDSPFTLQDARLALSSLRADLGRAGAASGSAALGPDGATLDLAVRRLDLRAVHRSLRATALDGTIRAQIDADSQSIRAELAQGGLRFAVDGRRQGNRFAVREFAVQAGESRLSGSGTVGLAGAQRFEARAVIDRFDPAAFGDFPSARINATIAATGELAPAWRADLRFELGTSRWRGAALAGTGRFVAAPDAIRDAQATLRIGANVIEVRGALGRSDDALAVSLTAPRLAEIDPRIAGQATLSGTLRGTLARPAIEAHLKAERLRLLDAYDAATIEARGALSADQDPRLDIDVAATMAGAPQFTLATAAAKVAGSVGRHVIEVRATGAEVDLASRLAGGWHAAAWTGTVESLSNKGRFAVELTAPATVELARERGVIGAAAASFGAGRLALARLRWEHGRFASQGEFAGIALAPFLAFVELPRGFASTLALRGAWAIDTTPRLNGTITLGRESGDVTVGESPRLPLELEQLEVNARFVDDAATGTLAGRSRRVGTATAEFEIGRSPGAAPGTIRLDAPLTLTVHAEIASLKPLAGFLNRNAIADGRLTATLAGAGTLRDPRLTGRIEGSGLALEVPERGIRLVNGRLVARLDADALRLDEFEIQGGEGRFTAKGVAPRSGTATPSLAWHADNLRLLGLPDLRLTVDGEGTLAVGRELVVEGALRARNGHIEFARRGGDRLGDDVEVRGRPRRTEDLARRELPLKLALDIDLGQRFHVIGAGLDTDLTGRLRIATRDKGDLGAKGTIDTVHGLYFFLGQRLEIERGRLIFDGPIENPALDVRAVRRGLPVEAGIELTGTVRTPQVTLTSSPPMTDGDKLAWLVLGRGLETASAADAVLLQSAATSLLDNAQAIPLGRRAAVAVGLDDISLKGGNQLQSQVVSVGKRLSDRLYLTVEQGRAVAQTAVGFEYLLGRGLRLRATGGQDSNVGVFFTRSWD